MLSEKKLKSGETFTAGEYNFWYFNKFRADTDWSKSEDESEREFDTYAELVEFAKKHMTLLDKLNRYGVTGSVSKGVVTLEANPDDLDELCDTEGVVNDQEFSNFLDELDTYEAYLDDHPEGSDRGGYVVWVEKDDDRCYYYEPDGEWECG